MKNPWLVVILLLAATTVTGVDADTQSAAPQDEDPLAPFARLIEGRWHTEGSYQEFDWGVGRKSVVSRSFFVVDGTPKLVSEGFWYWHPGEEQIRGVFTAIDMPVVLFDYTTWFEGDTMVSELRSYDDEGGEQIYRETWEFTDEAHYVWRLYTMTPEGPQEAMGATYERRESP